MDQSDYEDDDYMIMLGFPGVESLLSFIHWVYENFDTDDDFTQWFTTHVYDGPGEKRVPSEYDDKFWSIVNKSLKNVTGEPHGPFPDSN